jgi:hypothetical protein
MRLGHPDRVLALTGDVGGMAFLDEATANESRHLRLVLDDENAHEGMFAVLDESCMRERPGALTTV